MRLFLLAAINILTIISCNSKKSETKAATGDTAKIIVSDTANNSASQNNTTTEETNLSSIGDLSLDMTDVKTIELLGEPESKSKAEEWGADGLIHQDWIYKSKGITLNMSGNKEKAEQKIFSITVTEPNTFKTKKSIGIGSSYLEVMGAYRKDLDKDNTDKTSITVGSVYGGMIINFANNKATKIFIGAAAE